VESPHYAPNSQDQNRYYNIFNRIFKRVLRFIKAGTDNDKHAGNQPTLDSHNASPFHFKPLPHGPVFSLYEDPWIRLSTDSLAQSVANSERPASQLGVPLKDGSSSEVSLGFPYYNLDDVWFSKGNYLSDTKLPFYLSQPADHEAEADVLQPPEVPDGST